MPHQSRRQWGEYQSATSSPASALSAENAVEFLLHDQYLIDDRPQRIDLLEEVSEVTVDRLLSGSLPDPARVAETLGDVARQERLVGWSADRDE